MNNIVVTTLLFSVYRVCYNVIYKGAHKWLFSWSFLKITLLMAQSSCCPAGCREEAASGPAHSRALLTSFVHYWPPSLSFLAAEGCWALGPEALRPGEAGQQLERGKWGSRPPLFSWFLATLGSPSLVGDVTKRMLTLSHESYPYTLGSSTLRSLLSWFHPVVWTCEGPSASSILPYLGERLGVCVVLARLLALSSLSYFQICLSEKQGL